MTPSTDGAFELALCPWEHRHLTLFRETCGPGLAYTLSENATQRKTCATTEKLHCMTSSMHLLWNDVAKRWFTGRELFALQGFPVYQQIVDAVVGSDAATQLTMSSFNQSRLARSLPQRCRTSMTHQAGNSMHCSIVGSVLFFALCVTDFTGPSPPRTLLSPCKHVVRSMATQVVRSASMSDTQETDSQHSQHDDNGSDQQEF